VDEHDEEAAVAAANDAFYAAFEAGDLPALLAVWEHSDDVSCTHPGWPALHGWEAVRASWERMGMGPGTQQFIITDARIRVSGDLSWVTLDENLLGTRASTVTSVNLFRRQDDGRWLMVAHHGSPVMTSFR
jgi:ketosteroid isomerase-like protein